MSETLTIGELGTWIRENRLTLTATLDLETRLFDVTIMSLDGRRLALVQNEDLVQAIIEAKKEMGG